MSTNLQLYTGYYAGGLPAVLNPQPFDVAQDLSTGNLWQYNGSAWVAPSWSTAFTLYLGAAQTVCERLSAPDTVIPSILKAYDGSSDQVPAELGLSANDLAIKHDVGNYNIKVLVYRNDPISETVVEVPFPVDSIVSTEDGDWTILKDFNLRAGFDFCSVTLTFVSIGNADGPQQLEYITKEEANEYIYNALDSAGYATEEYVDSAIASIPIPADPVVVIDSTSRSVTLPNIQGGTVYRFERPLESLTIQDVPSSGTATVEFTAGYQTTAITSMSLVFGSANYDSGSYSELDWGFGPVGSKVVLMSSVPGGFVFTPDNYTWGERQDQNYGDWGYKVILSGGSIYADVSDAAITISAYGVSELKYRSYVDQLTGEWTSSAFESRMLDGLVASSIDFGATWTYGGVQIDAVYMGDLSETPDMGLPLPCSSVRTVPTISGVPTVVSLPSSVYIEDKNAVKISGYDQYRVTLTNSAATVSDFSHGFDVALPYDPQYAFRSDLSSLASTAFVIGGKVVGDDGIITEALSGRSYIKVALDEYKTALQADFSIDGIYLPEGPLDKIITVEVIYIWDGVTPFSVVVEGGSSHLYWDDGSGSFSHGNSGPDMSALGLYCLEFRWQSQRSVWLGKLKYKIVQE